MSDRKQKHLPGDQLWCRDYINCQSNNRMETRREANCSCWLQDKTNNLLIMNEEKCMPICLSIYLSVNPSVYLFVYLSVDMYVCLSRCMSICHFVYLSVCPWCTVALLHLEKRMWLICALLCVVVVRGGATKLTACWIQDGGQNGVKWTLSRSCYT